MLREQIPQLVRQDEESPDEGLKGGGGGLGVVGVWGNGGRWEEGEERSLSEV